MTTQTNTKAKAASLKLLRNSSPSNSSTTTEIKNVQGALVLLIRREREKAREARDLSNRCAAHAQHASRALTAFTRLVKKGVLHLILAAAMVATANAEPRKCRHKPEPNWILRRQEIGAVQGVPTSRLIIGKREVDIYRDGKAFEKDNRVR